MALDRTAPCRRSDKTERAFGSGRSLKAKRPFSLKGASLVRGRAGTGIGFADTTTIF